MTRKKQLIELGKAIKNKDYATAYDLYNELKDPNDNNITSLDEFMEMVKED